MKILYFAPISYDGLKQRPQHIADILAEENEVWYVEPTISLMRYVIKGGESYKAKRIDVSSNLHVIRLSGIVSLHISLQAFKFLKWNVVSERLQLSKYIDRADIIWVGYPGWYQVIEKISDKKIIFDKMDEDSQITQNPLLRRLLYRVEPKLVEKSDYIFVTANIFYKELYPKKANVFLLPNAVCEDIKFEKQCSHEDGKRVFGYVGTIAHWFDIQAIEIIAGNNSKNEIVLVGPNSIPKINLPNVKYLGTVSKEMISGIIADFDVCLYPFKKNRLLDTIDPVKIYEYLAMNKPVLAVNSAEMKKFEGILETYETYEELGMKLQKKMSNPFTEEERIDFINKNCWKSRVHYALEIIERGSV